MTVVFKYCVFKFKVILCAYELTFNTHGQIAENIKSILLAKTNPRLTLVKSVIKSLLLPM